MAKSKVVRRHRKAARPRTIKVCGLEYPIKNGSIEVTGHVLGPQQIEEFKAKADSRLARALTPNPYTTRPQDPEDWARAMGLDDLLAPYRPSKCAKERISSLSYTLSRRALSIGSMSEFLFWDENARRSGCKTLMELIGAAEMQLMRLRYFAQMMQGEDEGKLQDWIRHEKHYQEIGAGAPEEVQS